MSVNDNDDIPDGPLKPCPWCGTTDDLYMNNNGEQYFIACSGEECNVCGPHPVWDDDAARMKAVECWNRRDEPKEGA